MGYTLYDLSESVDRSEVGKDDIKQIAAAWGDGPGGSEWTGGFLMELKDGRWLYLTGWCDYTGWGCQDGIEEKYFDAKPELDSLTKDLEDWQTKPEKWDIDPVDLNRWVRGEISELD
jgi:hypothetical protein